MESAGKRVRIGKRTIGAGMPALIVAELSANHLQKYGLAVKTIKAMKAAGADAVKLQTYTPDTLTIDSKSPYFRISQGTLWDGKTLYDLYKDAYMPWEWQPRLKRLAEKLGMIFFSAPFDKTAVDFLDNMGVPAFKIASFELPDIPLIEYAASKGKPMILSTGIASLADINDAVAACRRAGNDDIILLKCTSAYPAPPESVNLRTMGDMRKRFDCVVGISDHTTGISVPVASAALGASMIEKHFILDRSIGGPDSGFSLDRNEFSQMVRSVREAEKALGKPTYEKTPAMRKGKIFTRSLFAVSDIRKGETFTEENVRSIRPGYGLEPKFLKDILGKKAKKNLRRGTPMKKEYY